MYVCLYVRMYVRLYVYVSPPHMLQRPVMLSQPRVVPAQLHAQPLPLPAVTPQLVFHQTQPRSGPFQDPELLQRPLVHLARRRPCPL